MPRLVPHSATGPIEVPPQDKSVWVCGCGLTQTAPFCDGSHKVCRQQETDAGTVYVYGPDKKTIVEQRPADTP